MKIEHVLLAAGGAAVALAAVAFLGLARDPVAATSTAINERAEPDGMRSLHRSVEAMSERLTKLEGLKVAAHAGAPSPPTTDAGVARLEAELAALRSEVTRLRRSAADSTERLPLDDEAHDSNEEELLADYESQREDIIADYEAALSAAPAAPQASEALEASVIELAGDDVLAGSQIVGTECRGAHCRLEFSHDGAEAQDDLAANIALFLPAGASSVVMPGELGDDEQATVVYLTLGTR